jgi:transcriptional regulator with XRE-family HTH domain
MSTRSSANPTVRRRELARRLRELRVAAGASLDDVAKELMCSTAKVSRMETGERAVQPRDLRDLCRFYAVSDAVRDDLTRLAREAAQRGWWQDFGSLDQQVATFVALESAATEIRQAINAVLPGLIQLPEFTRSLIPHLRPPGEMTPEIVEAAVRLRQVRQERLLSRDMTFACVVDEAAFRRTVGSPAIMFSQVERLIDLVNDSLVTFQVIPFSAGPHPNLEGSFQHMHVDPVEPDVVFVEGLLGTFLIEDPIHVAHYGDIFGYLSADVALSPDKSLRWLSEERGRWKP